MEGSPDNDHFTNRTRWVRQTPEFFSASRTCFRIKHSYLQEDWKTNLSQRITVCILAYKSVLTKFALNMYFRGPYIKINSKTIIFNYIKNQIIRKTNLAKKSRDTFGFIFLQKLFPNIFCKICLKCPYDLLYNLFSTVSSLFI